MVENKDFCKKRAVSYCGEICDGNFLGSSLNYRLRWSCQRSWLSFSSADYFGNSKYNREYVHASFDYFHVHDVWKLAYLSTWTSYFSARASKSALQRYTLLSCEDFDRHACSSFVTFITTKHRLLGHRLSKWVWEIRNGLSRSYAYCTGWSCYRSNDKCSSNKHKLGYSCSSLDVVTDDIIWGFVCQPRHHFCLAILDSMDISN